LVGPNRGDRRRSLRLADDVDGPVRDRLGIGDVDIGDQQFAHRLVEAHRHRARHRQGDALHAAPAHVDLQRLRAWRGDGEATKAASYDGRKGQVPDGAGRPQSR